MVNVGRSTMTRWMQAHPRHAKWCLPAPRGHSYCACRPSDSPLLRPTTRALCPTCRIHRLLDTLHVPPRHLSTHVQRRSFSLAQPMEATYEATPLPPPPPIDGEDDDVPSASLASTGRVVPDSDLDMSADLGQAIACPPAFLPRLKNSPRRGRRSARTMTLSHSGSQSEKTRKNMVSVAGHQYQIISNTITARFNDRYYPFRLVAKNHETVFVASTRRRTHCT
ncbi:hypothetical protein EDB84DRAFT_1474243 [Lactarius hengduanensis]|nr:hypothetical protein EDB84DRAFT_1474243 [Lactarius hengduanensis]